MSNPISRMTETLGHGLRRRRNWPLTVGLTFVLLIATLAAIGPALAPRDPLETNTVVKIGNEWIRLPYPPFTVPGFPLGSDTFGRDLLSRLLWGIRPTMILVTIVALIRLVLGVLIGVAAGWSTRAAGRALESLISGALAVPTMITALAAITAVGIQHGLVAFLVGLSLTGWAETARAVSEQTRALKAQPFVEAARAMGSSGPETVVRHVLRQITPMLGMLLAFEAGATLMMVAALGFLGYYLGGAFWIEVSDFSARAISGLPELGQMLANSWQIFKPWATFATGTVVFLAVLGFNLIGEGLRRRLSIVELSQRSMVAGLVGRAGAWIEETLFVPSRDAAQRRRVLSAVAMVALVIVAGMIWKPWQSTPPERDDDATAAPTLAIPGGHLWAAERRDAQGTLAAPFDAPVTPALRWVLPDASGFAGGPVVDAEENVYAASKTTLYSLLAEGSVRWQAALPVEPAGALALGPAAASRGQDKGTVYVADQAGGLSAFSLDGEMLWRYQTQTRRRASSGPVVGADGTVYYTVVDRIEAVSPEGVSAWTSERLPGLGESAPRLALDQSTLFVQDAVVDAKTGKLLDLSAVVPAGKAGINATYMIGGDGMTYLRENHAIDRWELTPEGPRRVEHTTWESRGSTVYLPLDSAVSRHRLAWLMYGSAYDDLRLVALSMQNQVVGNSHYPLREPRLVAVDNAEHMYVCGTGRSGTPECVAFVPGTEAPIWQVVLPEPGRVNGAALVPSRLYVTTREGRLYAVGDG